MSFRLVCLAALALGLLPGQAVADQPTGMFRLDCRFIGDPVWRWSHVGWDAATPDPDPRDHVVIHVDTNRLRASLEGVELLVAFGAKNLTLVTADTPFPDVITGIVYKHSDDGPGLAMFSMTRGMGRGPDAFSVQSYASCALLR